MFKKNLLRYFVTSLVLYIGCLAQHYSVENNILELTYVVILTLMLVFRILAHAGCLSKLLGDPYGTLVLTLASVAVEVNMIKALLLSEQATHIVLGYNSFALVTLACNLFGGICLLINGNNRLHRTTGGYYYLAFTTALIFWVLFLPSFSNASLTLVQQVVMSVSIITCFIVFLAKQNFTHTRYFQSYVQSYTVTNSGDTSDKFDNKSSIYLKTITGVIDLLFLTKTLIFLSALSHTLAGFCHLLHIDAKLISFLVAFVVLVPEGLFSILSTYNGNLARGINIFFGSVVASLSVTVSTLLIQNVFIYRRPLTIFIGKHEIYLLLLTLMLYNSAFARKKSTAFHGLLNIVTLVIYLVLSFKI